MIRPMIQYIADHLPWSSGGLVGAEVGVWAGKNAVSILKNLPLKTLYLIDPYVPYVDGDEANSTITDPSIHYTSMLRRVTPFCNRVIVTIRKEDSVTAAKAIAPEIFDFVYLDGCHTYEHVAAELEAYYPLVKSGGILGGHDIHFYGVMRAVGEFAAQHRLHPQVAGDLTHYADWWIVKP